MKFMLQLHKPPKCPDLNCGKEWMPSKINQTSHKVTLLNEMNGVAGDTLKKPEKVVCSMMQRQNFKGIRGKNHEHLQEYLQGVRRH